MRKRRYSTQNLSHYRLASYKMGLLYPVSIVEVLPGDIFRHSTSLFMRLSPLVTPVMHPVHVRLFHFYVPLRLIWEDWEDFRTGGREGMASPAFPTVEVGPISDTTLINHFGLPLTSSKLTVSALPFRAYTLIWNEWFRDQDVFDEMPISLASGSDTTTYVGLFRQAWGRDYFTTASPTPQRGPEVTIPVNAPSGSPTFKVVGSGTPTFYPQYTEANNSSPASYIDGSFGIIPDGGGITPEPSAGSPLPPSYMHGEYQGHPSFGVRGSLSWRDPALSIEYTPAGGTGDVGSISIADWREAMAAQRFEEHRALYGSRYTEYLRSMGIRASDARLQRPEYLGGMRQTIQFSEVLQTASDGDTPVGTLRGHGIAAAKSSRYRRFFEEDGFVISLLSVMPIGVYMQGLDKMWLRRTKEDFWTPEYQHLSQQPIYTRELYCDAPEDEIFGYQDIYDEYRQHRNSVSGEMLSILKDWHMARDFSQKPALNGDFISGAPTVRNFASQDTDVLYVMAHHSLIAKRLMSKRGTPR